MKIAVFSCNTGNFRNELSIQKLNNVRFNKEIDYFFFTDIDLDTKSCKWNIHKVELKESLDFINKYRNTAKYIKFCIPEILKSYDYIIWCDTKSLDNIDLLSINKINKLISDTNKKIYLIKHPERKNAQEEVRITLKFKHEKKKYGSEFLKKIENINFNSILPDTTTIIRKVDNRINNIFIKVYEELLNNKLCRDQNIIQYVFHNENCDFDLHYFSNENELRKMVRPSNRF